MASESTDTPSESKSNEPPADEQPGVPATIANSVEPGAYALEYQLVGESAEVSLTARSTAGTTYTERVNLLDLAARTRFANAAIAALPGITYPSILQKLLPIALEAGERLLLRENQAGGDAGDDEKPQKELLVALATDNKNVELFHTPGRHEAEPFAKILIDEHHETWPISSKAFKWWLVGAFEDATGVTPGSQAFSDALNVIVAKAMFRGPEYPVFIRVAESDGSIWIDLGNPNYEAVRITKDGWEILPGCQVPVRFIRRRGMLPLPTPVGGGSVHELRSFVNVPDDLAWNLLVAALVSYLWHVGPYIILVVNGEQGSAKSTLCRFIRSLIDPNKCALRRPPRDDRDLMIAATNCWMVALDNLSVVSPSQSDSLCSLATGGGFATRELYTDSDEKLFEAMRPVLLNGIPDLATRPDLLDRAIVLVLPTIPEDRRRDEAELHSAFEVARPRILGSLLDGVSMAMRRRDEVRFDRLPRMADFALIGAAAMPAFGWTEQAFLDAYLGNRAEAHEIAIEASAIGPAILALVAEKTTWDGTATELLDEIERLSADKTRDRKDWPKSPRSLREAISRLAPNLRASGINVILGRRRAGGQRDRLILLEKSVARPPARDSGLPKGGDGPTPTRDDRPSENRPAEDAPGVAPEAIRDEGDDRDGVHPTLRAEQGTHASDGERPSPTPPHVEGCSRPSQSSPPSRSGPGESTTSIFAGRSRDEGECDGIDDRPSTRDEGDDKAPVIDQVLLLFEGEVDAARDPATISSQESVTSNVSALSSPVRKSLRKDATETLRSEEVDHD